MEQVEVEMHEERASNTEKLMVEMAIPEDPYECTEEYEPMEVAPKFVVDTNGDFVGVIVTLATGVPNVYLDTHIGGFFGGAYVSHSFYPAKAEYLHIVNLWWRQHFLGSLDLGSQKEARLTTRIIQLERQLREKENV